MLDNPVLLNQFRGTLIENRYHAHFCLINKTGQVISSAGDINTPVYSRSALKLIQAIPLIEEGAADKFNLSDKEIAVICGSHNAEAEHQSAVRSILRKIGLGEESLHCGPQWPSDRATRNALVQEKKKPKDIDNNCSGKHAGFLALCRSKEFDTVDYLNAQHPSQQIIKRCAAEMHEINEEDLIAGEDGCSAPIFATSLYHQSIAYINLIKQKGERAKACKRIIKAILNEPFMLAGSNRYCTLVTKACKGEVIGKTGADGVFCILFPMLEMACAIKVEDGKMGPQYNIAQHIIEALCIEGAKHPSLKSFQNSPVFNWNKHQTGTIEPSSYFNEKLNQIKSLVK